jgi:hypothetical protein
MLMSFDSGVSAEEFQVIVSVRVRTVQPKSPISRIGTVVGGSQDFVHEKPWIRFLSRSRSRYSCRPKSGVPPLDGFVPEG